MLLLWPRTPVCASISSTVWADTQSFDLSGFHGISAAERIHVQVTTGEVFDVTAESKNAQQLEYLKVDVRRGLLRVQIEDTLLSPTLVSVDKVTIYVIMPNLLQAEALTGAEIAADSMSGPDLDVAASGGSTLRIDAVDGRVMSPAALRSRL